MSNIIAPLVNYRLNVDILYLIFQHVLYCDSTVDNEWPSKLSIVSLIALSHVCQLWRNVTLAAPTLWANIYFAHCELALESLKRSKGVLLNVTMVQVPRCQFDNLVEHLVPHVHRLRRLRTIDLGQEHTEYLFKAILGSPAPVLQTLQLSDSGRYNSLLPSLFDGHTPHLQTLSLRRFCSWPAAFCTTLTRIELFSQPLDSRPTMTRFLDLLEASPNLVHLRVSLAGPVADDAHAERMLRFRHLRFVYVQFVETAFLLRHFYMPPDAVLKIRIWHRWGIRPIFPERTSHLANMEDIRRVTLCNSKSLTITGTNSEGIDVLDISGDRIIAQDLDVWRLFGTVDFSKVQELWVQQVDDDDDAGSVNFISYPKVWIQLFEHFASLRRLVLCSVLESNILEALINQGEDERVLCPDLRTLHVYEENPISGAKVDFFLQSRRRIGRPLEHIKIMLPARVDEANFIPGSFSLPGYKSVIIENRNSPPEVERTVLSCH